MFHINPRFVKTFSWSLVTSTFVTCIVCLFATSLHAQRPSKTATFETTVDSIAITGTQEIDLDLGDQLCSEQIEVEWTIVNPLDKPINWPRSTSSCGCISGVPPLLDLAAAKQSYQLGTETVRFKIKLPSKPESLHRQIVFWDAGGMAHLLATVKANVQSQLQLQNSTIAIDNESKVTHSIELKATNSDVDLRKLDIHVSGSEIMASRFSATEIHSGTLELEIDPKLAEQDATQSSLTLEIRDKETSLSQLPLTILYKHRSTVIPKKPVFHVQGKELRSQLVIRSAGLASALANNQTLKAFAIERKGAKETKIAIQVETPKGKPDSTIIKLDILLKSEGTPKGFKPQILLLQCGAWSHEVAAFFPS